MYKGGKIQGRQNMSTGREAEIFCKVLRKAQSGKVSLREDLKGKECAGQGAEKM